MKPLPASVYRIGNSWGITIPKTLATAFDYRDGETIRARIAPNGDYFEIKARQISGSQLVAIIPLGELRKAGIDPARQEGPFVLPAVPFFEWIRGYKT